MQKYYNYETGAYEGSSFLSLECRLPTTDYFRAVAINARLMDLAAKSGDPGKIASPTGTPYTIEETARVMRLQTGDVASAIADLASVGIITQDDNGTYQFANWSKYQRITPSAMDDEAKRKYNAEKTAKSRAKKAASAEAEKQFNAFWELYPRKEAKAPALKVWMRLYEKDGIDPQLIIDALDQLLSIPSYAPLHAEKKFIPLPGTWLNQKRYEDVMTI